MSIIIQWQPQEYPTRTIIEDLMMRNGPADENSWSPFDGQAEEFSKQFQGYSRDIFSRKDFLSFGRNKDFDPMSRNPARQTLEEFPNSTDAANYFKNYCAGYKTHPSGQYITQKGIRFQPNYEDSDTGEVAPISYFEEVIEEAPELDNRQLFDRLTYLVKLIWQASVAYKASLFSFAFAYKDIIDNSNGTANRHSFKPYSEKGRLLRIKNGELIPFFHDNDQKYSLYTDAMDLFIDKVDKHLYDRCMEFVNILTDLGFDCNREDPMKYTKEFCDNTPCLYVDTETEFMKGAAFLSQIQNAGGISLSDTSKFFSIGDIDKITYTTRLHEAKELFMSSIRTGVKDIVGWKDTIKALLSDLGFAEVVADMVVNKLHIQDGFVKQINDNAFPVIESKGRCGKLSGIIDYNLYVLETGDLMAVLLNPATYEIRIYYSLTRKEKLGYAGIVWQHLAVT